MLAKVIAWGEDRASALNTLDAALGRYTLLGVDTNVEYLRLLINDPEVAAGHLDTGLIERRLPSMTFRHVGSAELIAAALTLWLDRTGSAMAGHAWKTADSWRAGGRGAWTATFGIPGAGIATVSITEENGTVRASVDGGTPVNVRVADRGDNRIVVEFDDGPVTFAVAAAPGSNSVHELYVGNDGWSCRLEVLNRAERLRRMLAGIQRDEGAADPEVRSPMPGTVVSVSVADGDTVEEGQALLAVEAMKMEHQLVASVAGTVHLTSKPGDLVKADQVLATIHVDTETNTNTDSTSTDSTSTDEEVQP